jgi:glyoxylase-like metal-dependent hydrolase (beta-lactamase superfamily II)
MSAGAQARQPSPAVPPPAGADASDSDDWAAPGAYQVGDGIWRLPLPLPNDGLRAVNVYVIEADHGLVAVDGGWAVTEARRALENALRAIGYTVRDIRRFLVTHLHRDHYSQAVAIRRELGTRVGLGIGERESLRLVTTPGGRPVQALLDQLAAAGAQPVIARLAEAGYGQPDPSLDRNLEPDEWLAAGQVVDVAAGRRLVAVHTPGHTRGHLVFVERDAGVLFAGDHVLPHITPSIGFEPAPPHLPLRDYLDSLRRVRAMPDLRLLPAHGPPAPSVHRRVDELLAHHDQRLQACLDAVAPTGSTGYEVARRLPWTRRNRTFDTLDAFNQMLAVCEAVAHLDLLVHQGRLTRDEHNGRRVYHR